MKKIELSKNTNADDILRGAIDLFESAELIVKQNGPIKIAIHLSFSGLEQVQNYQRLILGNEYSRKHGKNLLIVELFKNSFSIVFKIILDHKSDIKEIEKLLENVDNANNNHIRNCLLYNTPPDEDHKFLFDFIVEMGETIVSMAQAFAILRLLKQETPEFFKKYLFNKIRTKSGTKNFIDFVNRIESDPNWTKHQAEIEEYLKS